MQYSLTVSSLILHITAKFLIPSSLFRLNFTVNPTKFVQFAHSPRELRKIRTILIYALNKYFQIPDHKQSTPGNYSELRRFRALRPQFPWTMQNSHHSHQVWYDQISKNESSEPKEITANYADSALFAPTAGKLRKICDICTPKLRPFLLQLRTLL